jgi:hypothetical protein
MAIVSVAMVRVAILVVSVAMVRVAIVSVARVSVAIVSVAIVSVAIVSDAIVSVAIVEQLCLREAAWPQRGAAQAQPGLVGIALGQDRRRPGSHHLLDLPRVCGGQGWSDVAVMRLGGEGCVVLAG